MLRSRERNTNIITIQYTDDAQTLEHERKKEFCKNLNKPLFAEKKIPHNQR